MENKNQPAYPIVGIAYNEKHMGLTKREYFAAMAMQGILANPKTNENLQEFGYDPEAKEAMSAISKLSIDIAEELLKQLENGK